MDSTFEMSECLSRIDSDKGLRLLEEEPKEWTSTVDEQVLTGLTGRDVKRQESFYELVITEKNHCLLLKALKELFAEDMRQELNLSPSVIEGIFPCLEDLLCIHSSLLWELRELQRAAPTVHKAAEVLLREFSLHRHALVEIYGVFSSKLASAESNYLSLFTSNASFRTFALRRSGHSLLKKMGVPETLRIVWSRVTKYPIMMATMSKYWQKDEDETSAMNKLVLITKEIASGVNCRMAEEEEKLLARREKTKANSTSSLKRAKKRSSSLVRLLDDPRPPPSSTEAKLSPSEFALNASLDNLTAAQLLVGAVKEALYLTSSESYPCTPSCESYPPISPIPSQEMARRTSKSSFYDDIVGLCSNDCTPSTSPLHSPTVYSNGIREDTTSNSLLSCLKRALTLSQHIMDQEEKNIKRENQCHSAREAVKSYCVERLESLRHSRDALATERHVLATETRAREEFLKQKEENLTQREDELQQQQNALRDAREDFFRKLELVHKQGLDLSPNLVIMSHGSNGVALGPPRSHTIDFSKVDSLRNGSSPLLCTSNTTCITSAEQTATSPSGEPVYGGVPQGHTNPPTVVVTQGHNNYSTELASRSSSVVGPSSGVRRSRTVYSSGSSAPTSGCSSLKKEEPGNEFSISNTPELMKLSCGSRKSKRKFSKAKALMNTRQSLPVAVNKKSYDDDQGHDPTDDDIKNGSPMYLSSKKGSSSMSGSLENLFSKIAFKSSTDKHSMGKFNSRTKLI